MEPNNESIYLLANSVLKTLDKPILGEIPSSSFESLPEYNQKNYLAIKEILLRNYDSYKLVTKERLLKFVSDMEKAKESLICSIPVHLKCMKIKEILNSNQHLKIGERKWKSNNLIQDDIAFVPFDLSTVKINNKENGRNNERIKEIHIQNDTSNKKAVLKIDTDISINTTLQYKTLDLSVKSNKEIKKNKFVSNYRSPSPILPKKSSNIGRSFLSKSNSKEKNYMSSTNKLNTLLKVNTPGRKRPWIPS